MLNPSVVYESPNVNRKSVVPHVSLLCTEANRPSVYRSATWRDVSASIAYGKMATRPTLVAYKGASLKNTLWFTVSTK